MVSPRVAFTYFVQTLFAEFEPFIYLELNNDEECGKCDAGSTKTKAQKSNRRFFICQVESLHKVEGRFKFVIFDEFESIQNQFSSIDTMRNKYGTHWKIVEIQCYDAEKVVVADAFLSNKSMDTLQSFKDLDGGSGLVIVNHTPPKVLRAIETKHTKVFPKIMELLRAKKKFMPLLLQQNNRKISYA